MWFKNLVVFRLPEDWSLSAAELEDRLARRPLQACGHFDMQTRGWVHPSNEARYVYTLSQQHLFAMGVEQKLLPASVINQVTKERAVELEAQQGFPVGRRQMRELKDRVTEELRARAFSRRRSTHAWIDPVHRWLVIDSASVGRAEEVVETLRDCLGSLAVLPLETQRPAAVSMAAWLMLDDAPGRFALDQDLELCATDEGKATVRYVRHPLESKDIQNHIKNGKQVTRLGLTWNDRISFVLTEDLQIKRLKFLEIIKDSSAQEDVDPDEQFALDFALLTGELAKLLDDLVEALGGEKTQEQQRKLMSSAA